MFLDQVNITVIAGSGGNGIVSFRREKYVEFGGPNGGSGGRGGDIIFQVDNGLRTLVNYKYQKNFKSENGENGKTKAMHGRNAKDLILKIPPGTLIYDLKTKETLADLKEEGDKIIIARGGRGGRGNFELGRHGKGHMRLCENGEPGQQLEIGLELKLLADVGIVGKPSVGKSTFLSIVTNSKPKIAAYEFTTIIPNLGVVKTSDNRSYVMADLPGLIEGASQGKGLGHQFLKHIQRTKILVHILDMGAFDENEAIKSYEQIRHELKSFDPLLLKRPEIIIANKSDLPNYQKNLQHFKTKFPELKIYETSFITNNKYDQLLNQIADLLENTPSFEKEIIKKSHKNYYFKSEQKFIIEKRANNDYFVHGYDIERLVHMTDFSTKDNLARFMRQIKAMGIEDELIKAGVKDGDNIEIVNFEFIYKE